MDGGGGGDGSPALGDGDWALIALGTSDIFLFVATSFACANCVRSGKDARIRLCAGEQLYTRAYFNAGILSSVAGALNPSGPCDSDLAAAASFGGHSGGRMANCYMSASSPVTQLQRPEIERSWDG